METLFQLGRVLAGANASKRLIADALSERDATLGYDKYTDRQDGLEYWRIAEKVSQSRDGHRPGILEGAHYQYEEEQPFFPNWVLVDMQLTRATTGDAPAVASSPTDWQAEWYFNENIASNTPKVYSINYLIRSAR